MVGRIVAAVELPVTMDFEAGYGDAGTTARRAIEVGVVGGNLEDQMKPLDEAVAAVEAVLGAARKAGIDDFVLNARTDAALRMGDAPGPRSSTRWCDVAELFWRPGRRWFSCRVWSTGTRSAQWSTRLARKSSR